MLPEVQGEGVGVKRCGGVGGGDVCVYDGGRGGRHGVGKGKQARGEKEGACVVYV